MKADPLIGQKIGNYVISAPLQEGGMGMVYVAQHPEIGRRIAVKVVSEALSGQPGIADRFVAEARAISRIEHANIIDIYDFGRAPTGQLYYTMELLQGRELAAVMDQHGPMSAGEALPYVQQVCAALQAAHDRSVVHRDLKPENIFILDRRPMALKLLDFGIAKVVDPDRGASPGLTATGMVMGTPFTIAPEQAAGRPDQISPRTDIYSLGVIAYWMLAGTPPFTAEATALILAQHIKDPPPPLAKMAPHVPPGVAAVVEQCLAKAPSRRPASARELARVFRAAVEREDRHAAGSADTVEAADRRAAERGEGEAPRRPVASARGRESSESDLGETRPRQRLMADTFDTLDEDSASASQSDASISTQVRATTLQSAARARAVAREARSRGGWGWALGVGLLIGLGASLWWAFGPLEDSLVDDAERRQPTATSSAKGLPAAKAAITDPKPSSASPVGASDVSHIRAVTITADDLRARCEVRIGEGPTHSQPLPCHLQVTAGQRVRLRVVRRGYAPFLREWIVADDERVELRTLYLERKLVLVDKSVDEAAIDAGSVTKQPGRSPGRRSSQTRSGRPHTKASGRNNARGPGQISSGADDKASATELGEGTMSF